MKGHSTIHPWASFPRFVFSGDDVEDLRKQTAFSEMLEGLSEEKRREERLKLSRTWGVGWLEKSLVLKHVETPVVIYF